MIFSELYSVYYNTVAKILTKALEEGTTEQDLQKIVAENAFSESVVSILPSLKSGKWQLLDEDLIPVVQQRPTMPLTLLQKRWLKALKDDPRLHLFGVALPEWEDVEPLFTREDYRVFDQYADGDPFEDETYIRHFRLLQTAIREKKPVEITMVNRYGKNITVRFFPRGLQYSLKDDKIRVLAGGCRYSRFNLARLKSCRMYTGSGSWNQNPAPEGRRELVLEITDWRNALERALLHFAHFEKQVERMEDNRYRLRLQYYAYDETEMVIRVLSFGPLVKVVEPDSFVALIRSRLVSQKECDMEEAADFFPCNMGSGCL